MKKCDDLLQCRNFQKGNSLGSTENVFEKGKMRYIYWHRGMKVNIQSLVWGTAKILVDQVSIGVMKYNALQVQLCNDLKKLIVYSYFSAIPVWLYKVSVIHIHVVGKHSIYETYNCNGFCFHACHLYLYRMSLLQKEKLCEERLSLQTPEEKHPAASSGLTLLLSCLATSLDLKWMLLWLIVYDIPSVYELQPVPLGIL